jgi:Uma2 family endonuclease
MSAIPKRRLTVEEYLAIERNAEHKSEFFNGEMFAMAGASREHNTIKDNLAGELFGRLKGGPCRPFSSDQRVLVEATGLYAYPDVIIRCGPGTYDDVDRDSLTNPTALIEVLSPSTERYDRGAKFRNYQQIPTLKEYILVAQDEPVCERFVRLPDGSWGLVSFVGLDAELTFTSVAASIPLADVYAGVTFGEPESR